MHRRSALILSLALSLGLGACAHLGRDPQLSPALSTGDDVVARYGPPARIWTNADGGRTLEYSQQPWGTSCYMVRLGPDGRMISIEDTLLYASRFSIEPGMTPEQVSRLLGRERSRVFFSLSREDVWDWNVMPDQSGYKLRFNVHFKNGTVFRLSQSTVFPDKFFPFED
ncbi:hypothetical protein [Roseateles toxinivorans]|uniref:Beta-barrel assembly machine subunit BamE n=1 Tax=Roseateles toxinivorans TaxID=270368 RepID=A0A4R6QHM2_9BURK|nr:hypothetical protein [Roseateles toxinivorans]TDP61595.1 Beta-barrel assembly machine subunit BamE [Roseateles toxinivorans]